MKYSSVREHAQTGDVMLVEGKGIVSGVIRAFTGEKFSHVAMLVWLVEPVAPNVEKIALMIVEMREGQGWRMHRASDWFHDILDAGNNCYFGKAPESAFKNVGAIREYLFARRKLKYDYFGLIKVWWSQIRKKGFRKAIEDRTSEVCSTFAAGAWINGGWDKPDKDFDPGDFQEHCQWTAKVVRDPVELDAKMLDISDES